MVFGIYFKRIPNKMWALSFVDVFGISLKWSSSLPQPVIPTCCFLELNHLPGEFFLSVYIPVMFNNLHCHYFGKNSMQGIKKYIPFSAYSSAVFLLFYYINFLYFFWVFPTVYNDITSVEAIWQYLWKLQVLVSFDLVI